MFVGRHVRTRWGFIDIAAEREATRLMLGEWLGLGGAGLDPDADVRVLSRRRAAGAGDRAGHAFRGAAGHLGRTHHGPLVKRGETRAREFVQALRDKGRSVLLASHHVHQAYDVADRFLFMDKGRTVGEVRREGTSPAESDGTAAVPRRRERCVMGGRIRWALPASTRNQLWLTGLFLALLALFMMTGARAFLAWPMYESLLSTLPLYGFLALGLTLVVAAGEMDLCFPSTLAVAGFGFALTAIHTGQVWLGVIVAILIGLGIGLCNGFLVAYVGVPSIIATIGTQFFWRGAVMLLSQGLALGLADSGGKPHA